MNKQKNRKLQGSVLLTVVFVMSILIVFLFGTMALALAANNRAHVNYSSAQTGITARSVAESAVAALDKNVANAKEYKKAVGALKADSTPLTVKVGLSNPGGESLASMGNINDVVISYAGTKKYYDELKGEWAERDLLKFTSNVTMSGVTSSASVYVLKHDKGDGEDEDSGGAGFVTTAGVSFKSQTSIWGGAYIGLPEKSAAHNIDYTDHDAFINSFKTSDGTGNQIKNCDNTNEASMQANAVYLENEKAVIETNAYICNNLYVQNWSGFVFPGASTGITVWGDMVFNGNSRDESKSNCTYHGETKTEWQFNEIPYVYVDGKLSGGIKFNFSGQANTNVDVPLNVFCGQINTDEVIGAGEKPYMIGGNLYCMDENGNNVINPTNQSPLYNFTCSVVNKTADSGNKPVNNGDICCKGNLKIGNVVVNGDLRVQGTLEFIGPVTVKGNVVVGDEMKGDENLTVEGKIYYKDSERKIKLPNETGYYYKVNPTEKYFGEELRWCGADQNQVLNDGRLFINGEFQEDLASDMGIGNAAEIELYYTINEEENKKDNGAQIDEHHIDWSIPVIYGSDFGDDEGKVPTPEKEDDNKYKFYAKTEVVPGTFVNKNTYESSADYKVKVRDAEFEYGVSIESSDKYLADKGETQIYPEYAERSVLIGGDPDTKIVKTIEEVLTQVSNPYANRVTDAKSSLPKKLRDLYSEFKKDNKYKEFGDFTDGNINDSCQITGKLGTDVKINPNGNNMLLVMKDVSTEAGSKIIVDDTNGGNVYIIVEGTLELPKTCLLTKSYYDLIYGANKKIKYNSPQIGDADVIDLETAIGGKNKLKPCINIYGSAGSKIHCSSGYEPISANILSPDIEIVIESGGNKLFDNFYYNNVDVYTKGDCKEMFFGSMNARNVTIPNTLNVMYVTDGKKDIEVHTEDDDPFWYKILYYSEF